MSLYPSLEDMKVDQMMKIQLQAETPPQTIAPSAPCLSESSSPDNGQLYPSLSPYMGLEFSSAVIELNMPEYRHQMVAPLSGGSLGLHVTNGIRELTLCKDKNGRIGIRVHAIDNGIFVCLVCPQSPAAEAGLHFGDQILSINDEQVAGHTKDQVHKLLRNAPVNNIRVVVRDRPFERTITLHKDSTGHIGFQFKDGKIIALVKDSSAARNGLLTNHQILEINGKNVVGLKDKQLVLEFADSPNVVVITVIPSFIYDHVIKKMNPSLLKSMDHSVPNM